VHIIQFKDCIVLEGNSSKNRESLYHSISFIYIFTTYSSKIFTVLYNLVTAQWTSAAPLWYG